MKSTTWLKDGSEVRDESTMFSQIQILSNTLSATYQHTISTEKISNLVGSFTCRVVDVSGNMVERTLALNGSFNILVRSWNPSLIFYAFSRGHH